MFWRVTALVWVVLVVVALLFWLYRRPLWSVDLVRQQNGLRPQALPQFVAALFAQVRQTVVRRKVRKVHVAWPVTDKPLQSPAAL